MLFSVAFVHLHQGEKFSSEQKTHRSDKFKLNYQCLLIKTNYCMIIIHLMYGPRETVSSVFPRVGDLRGNKTNYRFPRDIKRFVIYLDFPLDNPILQNST